MKVERDLHMIRGDGETSYSRNSRLQEKAVLETKPVLEKAIREVYMALFPPRLVVADLGCSSGPNTFLVVSQVIGAVGEQCQKLSHRPPEVQFFLNDLPGNDFNLIFQSLEQFEKLVAKEKGGDAAMLPPHYIAGSPGSFYTRLFPHQSVHLFHSSYSLMWRSQVPEELQSKRHTYPNEGNIYIAKTTPASVVKLYQEQFQKDLSLFLKLRSKELAFGGQMVLTFLGRKNADVLCGELSYLHGLLAQALQSLVQEGRVEKEKLDSFNLPFYAPSVDEVKAVIKQNELFDVSHIQLFESNWDPDDDSEDDSVVLDSVRSGANVAKCIRAVVAPLIARHFGESILDELFAIYARNVAKHLEKEKTKYPVIVLSLKTRR